MKSFFRNFPWLIYLPIVAAPMLLFGIPLLQGKVLYWGTAGLQFVPWREFAYVQLEQGVLPLWNALNGMGAPLIANYQLAFFYPPGWLTILGHWLLGAPGVAWVYTLLVSIHLAWGGLGMAALLRSIGVKPLGQAISGLAFALTGYFVARASFFSMIWTGAWMGWILWAASGIASPFSAEKSLKRSFWLILFSGMMLLAGHAQLSWYILLFAGLWTFFGGWLTSGLRWALTGALIFTGFILAGSLLAGVQLMPTLEYLQQSQRADSYEYSLAVTYSYWPWRLLTFLNPEMFGNPGLGDYWGYGAYWEDAGYVGVFPLFLALGSLGSLIRGGQNPRRRGIVFLWIVMVLGLLLALGDRLPLFPWLYHHVPTFDLFQAPARWMIWPVAALCILAGFSADSWARPEGRTLRWTRLGIAAFASVFLGALLGSLLLPELKPGLMRGFMVFGMLGAAYCLVSILKPQGESSHSHNRWVFSVMTVLSLDLMGASLFPNPFIDSSFYRPEGVYDEGKDLLDGRVFISADDEYELKFKKYLRFNDTRYSCEFTDIRLDLLPNLNLLNGIDSANNFDPFVPARYDAWMKILNEMNPGEREPYLAFMGVESVIQRTEDNWTEVKRLSLPADELVASSTCIQVVQDEQEALTATLDKITRLEKPACIIVESSGEIPDKEYAEVVKITPVKLGYRSVKFRIDSDQPAWLRIVMIWYPGWRAKIDGRLTPLYRADYLFSAIEAPAGTHEVLLEYMPTSFTIGAGLTGVGLVITALVGLWSFRRVSR
jgi:hypothetical protein